MSGAVWASLAPAVIGVLGALAAWLRASVADRRSHEASASAQAAHVRIDNLAPGPSVKAQP